MATLDNIYQLMWESSITSFVSNTCELDHMIHSSADHRRGITVLAYLGREISPELTAFLAALKTREPEQYYTHSI